MRRRARPSPRRRVRPMRCRAIPIRARWNCARRSRQSSGSIRRGSSAATDRTSCSTSRRAPLPGWATRFFTCVTALRATRSRRGGSARCRAGAHVRNSRTDELLHLAAGTYAGVGDEILYVRYGFAVYEIAARRVGAVPVEADDKDYATDVDALLAAVTDKTRVVYLANPNNPTGTLATREEVARLYAGLPKNVLFVIDQAYSEYLSEAEDDGGLELAKTQPNVFITRTFSKIHGLAAERIGWGYAAAEVISALHRIRLPFNVTRAGQAAAVEIGRAHV